MGSRGLEVEVVSEPQTAGIALAPGEKDFTCAWEGKRGFVGVGDVFILSDAFKGDFERFF